MKIALLAPSSKPMPSPEGIIFAPGLISSYLADGLALNGHDVDFYAPKDSETKANLISQDILSAYSLYKNKSRDILVEQTWQHELFLTACAIEKSDQYEIIHSHNYRRDAYFTNFSKTPLVFTIHNSTDEDEKDYLLSRLFKKYSREAYFIGISDSHIKLAAKDFNFFGKVYNGINLGNFQFSEKGGDDILFIGRIMKRKGPDIAIKVAESVKKKIVFCGRQDYINGEEFYRKIKEIMDNSKYVNFVGPVPFNHASDYYKKAKLLIFPLRKPESFGLVMIESMACGTPVVAFGRGAVPEIVKDGVTGFICPPDDIDSMVKAVKRIYEMPEDEYQAMRRACRKHVEENFTVEKMVSGYEAVYKKVIADWKKKGRNETQS